jgi:hypothetical protein
VTARVHPGHLPIIGMALAEETSVSFEELAESAFRGTKEFFGL